MRVPPLLLATLGAGLLLSATKPAAPANANSWAVSLNGTELYQGSDYFTCPSVEVPVGGFSLNDSLLFEEYLCGIDPTGMTTKLEVIKQVQYGGKFRQVFSHRNTKWSAQCPIPIAALSEHIPSSDWGKTRFNVYVYHEHGPWPRQKKPALFQLVFTQE